jgi:gamma-glutamylcyclotransferase (GGCT)/AIG2-like uncharacterized protein YtfP
MYKLIAVYGSLRKGLHNHSVIEDAEFIGQFETAPTFSLYDLGSFPGLKLEGQTSIVMDVYKVNEQIAKRVDRLEGYSENGVNTFYDRTTIETPFGEAHTYIYIPKVYEDSLVKSGDWKKYYKSKREHYFTY